MKKLLLILFFITLILGIFSMHVNAASSSFEITTNSKRIVPGDVFDAKIVISNAGGLNSVQIPVKFDENVFEFQGAKLEDTANYSINIDSSNKILEVLTVNGNKTPLIINVTFKVKETAKVDSYKITLADVKISHLDGSEDEKTSKSLVVSINEKSSNTKIENILTEETNVPVKKHPDINVLAICVLAFIIIFAIIIILIVLKKKKKNN